MFLVNLADPLGRRYLKLGLEVEVRDPEAQAALSKYEAKIKDTLLLLLSSKTYDSLSTMKAKVELKQEVVDRLNQIVGKGSILRVYITEWLSSSTHFATCCRRKMRTVCFLTVLSGKRFTR